MGGPTFPLIFPEEIWELILGLVEDSEDVSSLITAIPELRSLLKRKGHLWLFGQAIPHIYFWLNRKDLRACRQTCVHWSRGVDKFIDKHPSLFRPKAPAKLEPWRGAGRTGLGPWDYTKDHPKTHKVYQCMTCHEKCCTLLYFIDHVKRNHNRDATDKEMQIDK